MPGFSREFLLDMWFDALCRFSLGDNSAWRDVEYYEGVLSYAR